jgi:uncharacterized membrane protein
MIENHAEGATMKISHIIRHMTYGLVRRKSGFPSTNFDMTLLYIMLLYILIGITGILVMDIVYLCSWISSLIK